MSDPLEVVREKLKTAKATLRQDGFKSTLFIDDALSALSELEAERKQEVAEFLEQIEQLLAETSELEAERDGWKKVAAQRKNKLRIAQRAVRDNVSGRKHAEAERAIFHKELEAKCRRIFGLEAERDKLRELLRQEWSYHHTDYDGPVPSHADIEAALSQPPNEQETANELTREAERLGMYQPPNEQPRRHTGETWREFNEQAARDFDELLSQPPNEQEGS